MRWRMAAAAGILGLVATGACFAGLHAQPARAQTQVHTREAGSRNVWDGVYTEAQAARGEASYRTYCLDCHGEDLEQAGDDMQSTLAGADFLQDWNELTASDLYERIRTTMPINKPGSVPKAATVDILAYIFSCNKFPAGKTELPLDTKMLKLVTITWKPDVK
jgi:S-disulfanyl-L-cysteine oxidoreductase SoxD